MFTSATSAEGSENDSPVDLLDFLSIVDECKVDFLPVSWHEGLQPFDAGGSSNLSESFVDAKTNFAFKRFIRRNNHRSSDFRQISCEILTLQHEAVKLHPNFMNLLGICWESRPQAESLKPVLVFPKAPLGNLRAFLYARDTKTVSINTRLSLCIDLIRAVAVLHKFGKTFFITEIMVRHVLTCIYASFTATSSLRISWCSKMTPGNRSQKSSTLRILA
jgi:hypothetical protein